MIRRNNNNKRFLRFNERLTSVKDIKDDRGLQNYGRIFYTIDDVIDAENITNEIYRKLQNNPNVITQLKTYGIYKDNSEKISERIQNMITIKLKDSPDRATEIFSPELTIDCSEDLITIVDNKYSQMLNKDDKVQWLVKDLSDQDMKDIANYINEKVNDWIELTAFHKKAGYGRNSNDSHVNVINKVLEEIQQEVEFVSRLLPRGKQRTTTVKHLVHSISEVEGSIDVKYRMNSSEPYTTFCSFYITRALNGRLDITCLDRNEDEVWSNIVNINNEGSIDDFSFVKTCVTKCFDEYVEWFDKTFKH